MNNGGRDDFPQDANRVNIHMPWELEYWSRYFGVSKEELIEAVELIGVQVADLSRYLKKS